MSFIRGISNCDIPVSHGLYLLNSFFLAQNTDKFPLISKGSNKFSLYWKFCLPLIDFQLCFLGFRQFVILMQNRTSCIREQRYLSVFWSIQVENEIRQDWISIRVRIPNNHHRNHKFKYLDFGWRRGVREDPDSWFGRQSYKEVKPKNSSWFLFFESIEVCKKWWKSCSSPNTHRF